MKFSGNLMSKVSASIGRDGADARRDGLRGVRGGALLVAARARAEQAGQTRGQCAARGIPKDTSE